MRKVGLGIKPLFAIIFMLSIALMCFVAARYWFSTATYSALQPLPLPRPLPQLHLQTNEGKEFSKNDLKSKWTLVTFGFAHCSDVCPLELEILAKVLHEQKNIPGQCKLCL